jgi:hypothetical protein
LEEDEAGSCTVGWARRVRNVTVAIKVLGVRNKVN